jgi:hypothetical protein
LSRGTAEMFAHAPAARPWLVFIGDVTGRHRSRLVVVVGTDELVCRSRERKQGVGQPTTPLSTRWADYSASGGRDRDCRQGLVDGTRQTSVETAGPMQIQTVENVLKSQVARLGQRRPGRPVEARGGELGRFEVKR